MASRLHISGLKRFSTVRGITIVALQALLIFLLVGAGWLIYRRTPASASDADLNQQRTDLQIFI